MAVPKRRVSHARAAKRRTHYKVAMKAPSKCKKCGGFKMPHRVCPSCGEY